MTDGNSTYTNYDTKNVKNNEHEKSSCLHLTSKGPCDWNAQVTKFQTNFHT